MTRAWKAAQEEEENPLPPLEVEGPASPRPSRAKLKRTYADAGFSEVASFNALGSNLITFAGATNTGVKFKVLIDCGASYNFVDSSFALRNSVSHYLRRAVPVEFANGELGSCTQGSTILGRIGSYRFSLQALEMDLPDGYDIIFGLPWFRQFQPVPDWLRSTFRVQDKAGTHILRAEREPRRL